MSCLPFAFPAMDVKGFCLFININSAAVKNLKITEWKVLFQVKIFCKDTNSSICSSLFWLPLGLGHNIHSLLLLFSFQFILSYKFWISRVIRFRAGSTISRLISCSNNKKASFLPYFIVFGQYNFSNYNDFNFWTCSLICPFSDCPFCSSPVLPHFLCRHFPPYFCWSVSESFFLVEAAWAFFGNLASPIKMFSILSNRSISLLASHQSNRVLL